MKSAMIFMKGGFGNQLFQFCFANYLKLNNYKVTINTDMFKDITDDTIRNLTLPVEYFGFKEASLFSKLLFKYNHKLSSSKKVKGSIFENLFDAYKFSKEDNFSLNNKNKKLYLNGYWKDMIFINKNKDFLISSLSKNLALKKRLINPTLNNYAMIHVRRGDFIKDDRHLNITYYKNSMDYVKQYNPDIKFDIFTDDYKWVKRQAIFKEVDNIFAQENAKDNAKNSKVDGQDDSKETIETFSKMLSYKNFIAGNSSFAFWAAFIRSDDNSYVTVPKPWFRNNSHPTLKKDNWFIVENK